MSSVSLEESVSSPPTAVVSRRVDTTTRWCPVAVLAAVSYVVQGTRLRLVKEVHIPYGHVSLTGLATCYSRILWLPDDPR
jgi:hypothetical protein